MGIKRKRKCGKTGMIVQSKGRKRNKKCSSTGVLWLIASQLSCTSCLINISAESDKRWKSSFIRFRIDILARSTNAIHEANIVKQKDSLKKELLSLKTPNIFFTQSEITQSRLRLSQVFAFSFDALHCQWFRSVWLFVCALLGKLFHPNLYSFLWIRHVGAHPRWFLILD